MKVNSIKLLHCSIIFSLLCSCGFEPEVRTIQGFTYDSVSSEPIPGVIVTFGELTYTTSFDGFFEFENIPLGGQEISATRVSYKNYSQMLDVSDGFNEITIELSLEYYPVSRVYDVVWVIGPFTNLEEMRKNHDDLLDWPEVIELNNDNLDFKGRVKLAKNGWLPIERDDSDFPRINYLIPIAGPNPFNTDEIILYNYLIFAGVEDLMTNEQISGWVGPVDGLHDYTDRFHAIFRN